MYRIRGLFTVVLLCSAVLWSTSTVQAQTPPTPSTWGTIKAMYNVSDQTTTNDMLGTNSIGSSMGIAWPFVGDSPNNWTGDEGERTDGADISACGGRRNSHSGAEYYARDLNRVNGTVDGKPIYAGITGKIVVATYQSGYGNTIVIYDANRRVAVRYAHLKSLSVSYGQVISLRKLVGYVGNSGTTSPHLHLVGFTNIDHFYNNGDPVIPTLCDSDYYACAVYFFS